MGERGEFVAKTYGVGSGGCGNESMTIELRLILLVQNFVIGSFDEDIDVVLSTGNHLKSEIVTYRLIFGAN